MEVVRLILEKKKHFGGIHDFGCYVVLWVRGGIEFGMGQ